MGLSECKAVADSRSRTWTEPRNPMKGRKENDRERTDGRKGADRRVAVRSRGCDSDEYRRDDSETVGTGTRASRGAGQVLARDGASRRTPARHAAESRLGGRRV